MSIAPIFLESIIDSTLSLKEHITRLTPKLNNVFMQ